MVDGSKFSLQALSPHPTEATASLLLSSPLPPDPGLTVPERQEGPWVSGPMFGNRLLVLGICQIGGKTSRFSSCYPRELHVQGG